MLADNNANVFKNGFEYNNDSTTNILDGLYEFLKEAELQHYFEDLNVKLKVRSIAQLKYVDETDLQTLGMTRPEMRRLKKYFAKEFPQTAMGKIKKRLSRTTSCRSASVPRPEDFSHRINSFSTKVHANGQSGSPIDNDDLTTITSVNNFSIASNGTGDSTEWRQFGNKHLILNNQLTLGPLFHHGDLTDIYKGNFRSSQQQQQQQFQVAIKVINKITVRNDISEFIREMFINCCLEHPNVMGLYGISLDEYSIKMVTELAQCGSLTDCLLVPESKIKYPITVLHGFSIQICDAMSYLEERRVIHGRLNGKNVLLFRDNQIKLTDAGLFRIHMVQDRSDSCLWLSPEVAKGQKESSHSDVWAFGVLMWEIYSYCEHSHSSHMDESMSSQMDMRIPYLPQPDLCPNMIYQLMQTCWIDLPKERPSFYQLSTQIIRLEPEQVVALVDGPDLIPSHRSDDFNEPSDDSYSSLSEMQMLYYKTNDIIIVLDRSMNQYKELWRGSLLTGESGYFKWMNMRALGVSGSSNNDVKQPPKMKGNQESPDSSFESKGLGIGEVLSKIRISRREEKKKQSRLSIDMISGPQNDFRHVGHVGANGEVFGDLTSLYATGAQKNAKPVAKSVSSKIEYSTSFSEASSLISSSTLNAAGDDTPPYATIDSKPVQSKKSKEYSNKSMKKDNTTLVAFHPAPPIPPVRSHSEDESNTKTYPDDLGLSNNLSICDDSFSLFDELSKHWEMHSSKMESPTSETVVNNVLDDTAAFYESPASNAGYSELYDDQPRSNSDYVPMRTTSEESNLHCPKSKRSDSLLNPSMSTGLSSVKSNILQKFRVFGSGKQTKSKDLVDGQKSPIYAKVNKSSKLKKEKEINTKKKNIISMPIIISSPVANFNACMDDSFIDSSSEVSSLQPSPRESVLCLTNNGTNFNGISDPSPNYNRHNNLISNNLITKTCNSTTTYVSPASSFTSLTSNPANNVLQGGGALRALRNGDCVFRAPSAANAQNRKRPSIGQIQVEPYLADGSMLRNRQPSLPITSVAVKMITPTNNDRRNTVSTIIDNYEQLDDMYDSSATTPVASELPDLPYIDLSFVRTETQEKVNPCDEDDAYNSLHSGSLGSDTIEPRSITRQSELSYDNLDNLNNKSSSNHMPYQTSVNIDESGLACHKSDVNGRTRNMNSSKYINNYQNNSKLFSINGDNDEIAL